MNFTSLIKRIRNGILLLCLAASAAAADEAPAAPETPQVEPLFARVNGKPVAVREYNALFGATLRQRYYHGRVPEGQEEVVRKEVADLLIERELLIEEALRRGLQPDAAKVEEAVTKADARYGASPMWEQQRDKLLPGLKKQIARQSLLEQFEKAVRDVPPPPSAEVRAYYDRRPDLFTEPERLSLSVILLKVDPGAPKEGWDKAREEAQAIYLRIKEGADFAEQARLHSGDSTAANGGNMGYVHGGMLPSALQERVDKFEVGVVAEPLTVLEGVALFRVDVRVPPKLREFPDVEQRATVLFHRDLQDQAWQEIRSRLRDAAKIEILVPMGDDSAGQKNDVKPEESVKPKEDVRKGKKKAGGKKAVNTPL